MIAGATVAVSFSAIFIRIAGDDAGTIVWLRMGFAAVLLVPWAQADLRRERMDGRRLGVTLVSGLLLSGHFLLWTASLALTSISASVLLVCMHPVLVAPLGRRLLGDPIPAGTFAGIGVALAGTLVTCGGDLHLGGTALAGDGLALGGAFCLAGYLVIGRSVRANSGVAGYSALVFAVVSLTAAAATAAAGALHAPSPRTVVLCLALAMVCTIGGHTAYNWALRFVSAVTVSVAFLGEPPLTALLGLLLLGSAPSATTLAGGALILTGLTLTLRSSSGSQRLAPAIELE